MLLPQLNQVPRAPGEVEQTHFSQNRLHVQVDWTDLVSRVERDEPSAVEQLYKLFNRGIRYFLCRQLGPQDLDDRVHDTFMIVLKAIRNGELREPERIMGFVRIVTRRQVANHIEKSVRKRRDEGDFHTAGMTIADPMRTPEEAVMIQQKAELMKKSLAELSARDREILVRFYLHEETQESICRELQLTDTQFRLLKSRAKAKFGQIGRRKLSSERNWSLLAKSQAG